MTSGVSSATKAQRSSEQKLTSADIKRMLQNDEQDAECKICLVEYEAGDSIRRIPCLHSFHVDCVDAWLANHRTCPICRADITKD